MESQKDSQMEVDLLSANRMWVLVDFPRETKLTETQMIFEGKREAECRVNRYKGLMVSLGDTQTHYDYYVDIWAPVTLFYKLRALLSHCVVSGLALLNRNIRG